MIEVLHHFLHNNGNIVTKKHKNLVKMVCFGAPTDAIVTNAYKTGMQEGWCAVYKINDDEALARVPIQEDTTYWGQYAPLREREQEKRLKALSRGPEKTRYYQLGQLNLVTWYWSTVVKPDSPIGRVTATPREQPTQPLDASYDLKAGSGSFLLTPEPTQGE